ncbi:MAG: proline--tRNA ligase [Bacilli bacterium]|nr:proline--tRNA ligase [Bacilli bacterium]
MANEKKFVQSITSRSEDFAQWYTDVVKEAKLCDYSGVKGCLNYLPNGYAIWENIQKNLDARFKETGVENVYLPVIIPESLLQKESKHVEGFAPEVAWVTHGGGEKLEEKFCIRPTSETLFCDLWQKIVKSYRDLPLVWNQWNSVLRWEKTTRPFLRSREFLWQEGHTIHATAEEAEERTKLMFKVYHDFVTEELAIPLICGKKTESEKFAGAEDTYTIEAMMHDGKALQSGTSHFFGNGFPDTFDIKYLDKNNNLHSVYETSWGLSTRIIGAIIMVHGDDSGLVLPPRIAPTQTMIIPIAQHKEGVLDKANDLVARLKKINIRVKVDDSEKTPGFKFSEQEMLGIPTRIEIGPKDIENNQLVIVRRDTREKITISIDDLEKELPTILDTIQKDMYDRAKKFLDEHIYEANTLEEMKEIAKDNIGFIKASWCGSEECEDIIKYETGGCGSRCMPLDEQDKTKEKCVCCGKNAKHYVVWGKSY